MSGLGVVPGRYSLRETPSHGTHPLSQPRIALKSRNTVYSWAALRISRLDATVTDVTTRVEFGQSIVFTFDGRITPGATPSAFAPGVAPCAAKTPHTLRLALRFLSLRGFFIGYRLNLRRQLRYAPHLPLALRVPSAPLRGHSSSSGSLFWSLPLRFRDRCVSPRGWLRYRYASPRAERSRTGVRSWALPIPAIIGGKVTGWRPFMGAAHTRHNRRKGHGLAPVHGRCPYPP